MTGIRAAVLLLTAFLRPGYDLGSGLGTIDGARFCPMLAREA